MKLDADMQALRADALPIVLQDEANLGDDRILVEVYTITGNATGLATAKAQVAADRAQAEANRAAIFGDLCPSGYECAQGHGPGFGPPPGMRPDGPPPAR